MCKPPTCGLYQNRPCVRAESLGDGRHGWGSLNRLLPAGPSAGTQEGGVGGGSHPWARRLQAHVHLSSSATGTGVPLVPGFAFRGFGDLPSATARKYKMENSRTSGS